MSKTKLSVYVCVYDSSYAVPVKVLIQMKWTTIGIDIVIGRTSDFLNNGIYYHVIHHIEAKTERNALAS